MSETKFEIRKAKDGQFYWIQKAANGEILSTSETYKKMQSAIDGAVAAGATDLPLDYVGEPHDEGK